MTMPRVSVPLPVYNTRPEHLREAIDSILAQPCILDDIL